MILRPQLLNGPKFLNDSVIISRRRNTSVPVTPKDKIGWLLADGGGRELILRSPIDPNEWLTVEQRECLITSFLSLPNVIFTTRKGFTPIIEPSERQIGWRPMGFRKPRKRYRFENGEWKYCPLASD